MEILYDGRSKTYSDNLLVSLQSHTDGTNPSISIPFFHQEPKTLHIGQIDHRIDALLQNLSGHDIPK